MKNKRIVCLTVALATLSGCALFPMEKSKESSLKTTENLGVQNSMALSRAIEGEKTPSMPNLSVSGASNKVEITVNPGTGYKETTGIDSDSKQKASSDSSLFSSMSVSLPWGIALLAIAAGIAALTFAVRYAIKSARASSVAVDQAFRTGDEFAAEMIRQARTKMNDAMAAGKLADATAHATSLAELESYRGKLKAKQVK
jgi:hypothetical protein